MKKPSRHFPEAETLISLHRLAEKTQSRAEAEKIKVIAGKATHAKKVFIDSACHAVIERTSEDTVVEEILGQLKTIRLPFSSIWVEGQAPDNVINTIPVRKAVTPDHARRIVRFGALLTQEGAYINICAFPSIKYSSNDLAYFRDLMLPSFKSLMPFGMKEDDLLLMAMDSMMKKGGGCTPCMPAIHLQLHPDAGITFDEEKTIRDMEKIESFLNSGFRSGLKNSIGEASDLVDRGYFLGEHIARMLIVLNATARSPDILQPDIEDDAQKRKNLERKRLNRPPILDLRPIDIDVTRLEALKNAPGGLIQKLLGWTSVRRSKPIISKYGKIFTRKEHERRIRKAEDRREAVRIMQATKQVIGLSLESYRPEISVLAKAEKPSHTPE